MNTPAARLAFMVNTSSDQGEAIRLGADCACGEPSHHATLRPLPDGIILIETTNVTGPRDQAALHGWFGPSRVRLVSGDPGADTSFAAEWWPDMAVFASSFGLKMVDRDA
jgi:hypothetical protein